MGSHRTGVILASPRSGTTVIGTLLGAQPGTHYFGEVFHSVRGPHDDPDHEKYRTDAEGNFFSFKERFVGRFPALVYPSPQNQAVIWKAYGAHLDALRGADLKVLDVKYASTHHLNPVWQDAFTWPGLFKLLASEKAPILHLVREDAFAQAVSALRAHESGIWHQGTSGAPGPDAPRRFDPVAIDRLMSHATRQRAHFSALLAGYPAIETLSYETALEGGDVTAEARDRIARVFGMKAPLSGPAPLRKLAPPDLRTLIGNPEELLAHFAGKEAEPLVRRSLAPPGG